MKIFLLSLVDYVRAVIEFLIRTVVYAVFCCGVFLAVSSFYALNLIPQRVVVFLFPRRDA